MHIDDFEKLSKEEVKFIKNTIPIQNIKIIKFPKLINFCLVSNFAILWIKLFHIEDGITNKISNKERAKAHIPA